MITLVFTLVLLAFTALYYATTWKFSYWKKRKIPYVEPTPLVGNFAPYITQRRTHAQVLQELCKKFPNAPYFGTYYGTEPTLVVQDPEILKIVMTKDYYYFSAREIFKYTDRETVSQNMFFSGGDRWKVLRQNLTPIFSSSKMKNMFYLIDNCCRDLEAMLDNEIKQSNVQAVRPLMARYTMDCISSSAFGVNARTMEKDWKDNKFKMMGDEMFPNTYYMNIKHVFRTIWPAIFYGLGLKFFPVDLVESFKNFMKNVFASRDYKPTTRNDFIDLILNWHKNQYITGDKMSNKKGGDDDTKKISLAVDDDILVVQCAMFFAAGFETSATTLHYTLYELAKNPQSQQRVLEEIDNYLACHNNKLEYDCITELPFIDACVHEALRLYPVLGVNLREVVDDYVLPCGAVIEKGVRVHIPVFHMHRNPDFFPDPEEYRPERFYGEARNNIKPYTYMPFGEGPRLCLGMRFAKMQMYAGLVTVLKKYRVELAEGVPRKVEFSPKSVITQPNEMIRLKFLERDGWEKRQFSSVPT